VIDPARGGPGRLCEACNFMPLTEICRQGRGYAACRHDFSHNRIACFFAFGIDKDVCTARHQSIDNGAPDSSCTAGHESDLIFKIK
jgi:hypothetical protein